MDAGLNSLPSFNFLNMRNYADINSAVLPRSEDAGRFVCWHITTSDSTPIKYRFNGAGRSRTTFLGRFVSV